MAESNFEEAKENTRWLPYEKPQKEESNNLEEDKKVHIEFFQVKERVSEKDIEEPEVEQKAIVNTSRQREKNKKKKKKRKEAKKEYMTAFLKQVDLKAVNQAPMLPIEEYFSAGDSMPIFRRGNSSMVLRLLQTHFKELNQKPCTDNRATDTCQPISELNQKFYEKRYYLFSKYDEGIKLDEESWYSVTPEELAEYIAKKCKCGCILDAFCGAGGNSIQFAMQCTKVYANDVSVAKTEMALHNAKIYNVHHKISFLNKDFLVLDKARDFDSMIDIVFISAPWGGISYSKDPTYDLNQIKPNLREVIRKALLLADNIVLFLPRNTDLGQLEEILSSYDSLYSCSNECIVTVEALIKGKSNISALAVFIGPLFRPKAQELLSKIKNFFKPTLEMYQGIIVQNIIKAKSFVFCYEIAKQFQKKQALANAYMERLKQALKIEEWNILKKLHKLKQNTATDSMLEETPHPECIMETLP